ncbi:MAG: PQQ-binding-like beta-propeller repeat protein [Pirellulales bacterium]|nr:PQQ-binding-like beta-propeller repeat protein [Pirellulales bacterium]
MTHNTQRPSILLAAIAVLLLLPQTIVRADDHPWNQFRGPGGSAAVEEADAPRLPLKWTEKDYRWRVKLPGDGWSSPVIWGEQVFVTSALPADGTKIIRCLKTENGEMVWERSFPADLHPKHDNNSFASSTPVLDEKNVYMTWATPKAYIVVALDKTSGQDVWRRDLGPYVSEHGFGASPILVGDLLILPNDQDGKSSVFALDRRTGKTRWEVPRKTDRTAFATPCLFQPPKGPPQLILSSSADGVTSLDPETGKKNWALPVFEHRVVGSPVVCSSLVFAACGSGGGGKLLVAIRPGDTAKGTKAEVVHEVKQAMPYVVTPVARGERIFLWADSGIVNCMDAPSGKVLWRKRIGGKYFGSPVRVGGRLYCMSREGKMVVMAAEDKFQPPLAEIDLGEPSFSTPAVYKGVMYIRTRSHLMALEGK